MASRITTNIPKYPPTLFHSTSPQQSFHIASMSKFASIFLPTAPQLDILFAPFFNLYHQNQQQTHYAHLFRANPLYQYLKEKKEAECRLVFKEVDMYVSPVAYQEKELTHRVVPTWNYVAVQFRGIVRMTGEQELRGILEKEVEMFQGDVGSKWRLSDAPNDYVQTLMQTIFGIRVDVSQCKTHKKLSQNKSQKQFNNTKKWCEEQLKKQKSIVDWMNYYDPYK